MTAIKHLVIGDNAFIGVSHLSHSKARETLQRLNVEKIVEVIRTAISCGANGFTFTIHPTNMEILKELVSSKSISSNFTLYPSLPYAAGYLRTMNEKGIVGTLGELFDHASIIDKIKLVIGGGLPSLAGNPIGFMNSYVNYELSRIPKGATIRSVLLQDVVTDLLVSYKCADVMKSYTDNIRNKWHTTPGFVTRNFSRFIEFFNEMGWRLSDVLVMTPFNSIGFQMNPSKQSCEECLSKMGTENVFAMSILAGGCLPLTEAVAYIKQLSNLSGIVAGVSSLDHAERTFMSLRELN